MPAKGRIFALVLIFGGSLILFSENNLNKRLPASVNDFRLSCLNLVKNFSKKVKQPISRLSAKARLQVLKSLASSQKDSPEYFYRYSNYLNSLYQESIISKEELLDLIEVFKQEGVGRLFWHEQDNKVLSYRHDQLASDNEIEKISKQLQREFTNISSEIGELRALKITLWELEYFLKAKPFFKSSKDINQALLFLRFVRGSKKNDLHGHLGSIVDLYTNKNTVIVKKFLKITKKIRSFQKREYKKLRKIKPSKQAYDESLELTKTYSKLIVSCKAKTTNIDRIAANRKFLTSMLAFEAVNTTAFFAYTHRDEEKDEVWWDKLAFALKVSLPWAAIRTKIVTNPGSKATTKIFTDYMIASVLSIGPTYLYDKKFGVNEKKIKERLTELLESKSGKELIAHYLGLVERHKLTDDYKQMLEQLGVKDFEELSISFDDMDKDQEKLFELIAKETYYEQAGRWSAFNFGSVGKDIFIYDKLWGLNSSIRNVAISLIMYDILCGGAMNPRRAYALTFAIYSVNKLINEGAYQTLKYNATGH